jgi:hypothetical protein
MWGKGREGLHTHRKRAVGGGADYIPVGLKISEPSVPGNKKKTPWY